MQLLNRNLTARNLSVYMTEIQKWILMVTIFVLSLSGCSFSTNTPTTTPTKITFTENEIREASTVIVDFETLWLSEQSHRDPVFQAELATGEYLDRLGYANSNVQSEVEWLVTGAAKLESLQLIEYNQQRFKAEACVITSGRKIRPDGTFLGLFSDVRVCGIYVFVKTENKWKLLGFLNNMDPRDYEHTPDWLKEIIGEVPQN
jgi:hypothetical protein